MKPWKATTKYQLIRDGDRYDTVYDHKYEAENIGGELVSCGFIHAFIVVPVKAVWLKV